jgi:nucleoid-associated protein YgaU
MALEKLKIQAETAPGEFDDRMTALFNPSAVTIEKRVQWSDGAVAQRDVPAVQHTHGHAAVLTIDLFFDTYEEAGDVRQHTDRIVRLTTVEGHGNMHRPPVCRLLWGRSGVFFQGVLVGLTQRFTMFLEDGAPVRATLGCVFKEWRDAQDEARRQNKQSVDVAKTWTVRRGDSLATIATREYHDPARWRVIAEANAIVDPLDLAPGRVLLLPTL